MYVISKIKNVHKKVKICIVSKTREKIQDVQLQVPYEWC